MTAYVINPFTPIPKSEKSHVRGWAIYWSRLLDAQILGKDLSMIKSTDEVYIDHGVNFSGGLNLFGGVDDDLADRLAVLVAAKPSLYSLDVAMPSYHTMLARRIGQSSTSKKLTQALVNKLANVLTNSDIVTPYELKPRVMTVGDSHSTAFAKQDSGVLRTNGRTLRGFTGNQGAFYTMPPSVKEIAVVHGSIDIRHHLMREPKPEQAVKNLVKGLVLKAETLEQTLGVKIELATPVPVEYEDRRIPKTGYFDGTPFFGSQKERAEITNVFIKELTNRWGNVVMPPKQWYKMDPEDYANTIMEHGSSVHIAPTHYRSTINWE